MLGSLLDVPHPRAWYLALDETYWRPSHDLISGLAGSREVSVLGGSWDPSEDRSVLDPKQPTESSHLSKLTLDVLASRTDSMAQTWQVLMVPMPQGAADKGRIFFDLVDRLLASACDTFGVPPLGVCYDAGTCNMLLHRTFLELVEAEALEGTKFFSRCTVHGFAGLPFIPYHVLAWGEHKMLSSLDTLHVLKRLTLHHHMAVRTVHYGDLPVDLAVLLASGCSFKAFVLHDLQSDREALNRLNPAWLKSGFASAGAHVYQFLCSLISAATEGSDGLTSTHIFLNAMSAYYLLLLNLWSARHKFKESWSRHFLPLATVRNSCSLCAQIAALCIWTPAGCSVKPSRMAEKICEHHYGQVKSSWQGSPSIRDAVLSVQKKHISQLNSKLRVDPVPFKPIPEDAAKNLAQRAFERCCLLQSWISVGWPPEEIRACFSQWYVDEGRAMLTGCQQAHWDAKLDEDDETLEADLEELIEAEGDQPAEPPQPSPLEQVQGCTDYVRIKSEIKAGMLAMQATL